MKKMIKCPLIKPDISVYVPYFSNADKMLNELEKQKRVSPDKSVSVFRCFVELTPKRDIFWKKIRESEERFYSSKSRQLNFRRN